MTEKEIREIKLFEKMSSRKQLETFAYFFTRHFVNQVKKIAKQKSYLLN